MSYQKICVKITYLLTYYPLLTKDSVLATNKLDTEDRKFKHSHCEGEGEGAVLFHNHTTVCYSSY